MPLSLAQQEIARSDKRWRVAVCGRRFGKTTLAIRELARFARQPNSVCWYCAPTRGQGKGIVWEKLKAKFGDLRWLSKTNESELTLTLVNGSEISIKSADAYDRMRGFSVNFVVLDEFADMDGEEVWTSLRPTLSDRRGHALFIGTPKNGRSSWAYEIYTNATTMPEDWQSWSFSTLDGGFVPEEEVEAAKRDMDERLFRQEYLATWEESASRVWYAFDRAQNVKPYTGDRPDVLSVGIDFNLSPMSMTVGVRHGEVLHIIDEICLYSSNTQEAVEELLSRYPKAKIWAYPDPAGQARSTKSGGASDFTHLRNAGFIVKAPHSHQPIRDRVNATNARFCNAKGERRLFVDPRCRKLIESLERHTYQEGASTPDKTQGFDHITDALSYCASYIWPIKRERTEEYQPQTWGHRTGVNR